MKRLVLLSCLAALFAVGCAKGESAEDVAEANKPKTAPLKGQAAPQAGGPQASSAPPMDDLRGN
ncbi:MAG: hypothetical protein K8H99_00390 [Nitrospirae bacterium]|nr:hypothetical protein [Fimbriimonadaceae bacterium]